MRKLFFLSVLLVTFFSAVSAQTLKIAHKSHAGKAATFSTDVVDFFGWFEPPPKVDDTVAVPPDPASAEPEADIPRPWTPVEVPVSPPAPEQVGTPIPEQVNPPETKKQEKDRKPGKQKKNKRAEASGLSPDEDDYTSSTTQPEVVPSPQLAAQRSNRMTWLYGLMGLVILPGIVLASGAFRKSADSNA